MYVYQTFLSIGADISASALIDGTAVANFDNTISFGDITVTDSNGNPIQGTFASDLGFVYGTAAAVSEPGSIALAATGIFCFAAVNWLRCRGQRSQLVASI